MYSTVSIRMGISWCVQYSVKDRDLLVCTVSIRRGISWCVQYCANKDRDFLVCAVQYCVNKDSDLLVCTVLCQ